MADAYLVIRLGEVRDVPAKITFATVATISGVTCTLKDSAGNVAGGINGTAGLFINQLGTLAADTVWKVWFDDFDPATLDLAAGYYNMYIVATTTDGDRWEPIVGVKVV